MKVDHPLGGFLGRVLDDAGDPIGTCFQVIPGVLVTAWHVLDDLGAGAIGAAVRVDTLFQSGPPRDAQVERIDPLHDLAVLVVAKPLADCVEGLAASDEVAHTTPISITGWPEVNDPGHSYGHLDADGYWAGSATRDQISLGRVVANGVMRGMSGAPVLLDEQVVVGVVSGRYNSTDGWLRDSVWVTRTENLVSLLSGIDRANLIILRSPWELSLQKDGLHVWSESDFRAGLAISQTIDDVDPIEPGEPADVTLLRQGRLLNLQLEFSELASKFERWLSPGPQRVRPPERFRVFWLESDSGPHRSKGLLACLARAGANGRLVYDSGSNIGLIVKALNQSIFSTARSLPPLMSVDLDVDNQVTTWKEISGIMTAAKRKLPSTQDPYPRMIVAGTSEQRQAIHEALRARIEITALDTRGFDRPRAYSFEGTTGMESETVSHEDVFNRGLPITTKKLYGREIELDALRDAWASRDTKIVSVVAYGGTGKSALVNTWLREMRSYDYRGARKVLAWSFYSQGTKENLVSADPFISFGLTWLEDDSSVTLNPWARGLRLAALIKQHRFLLILDGMEPLQHPLSAPDVGGQLTDDSIRALLEELAKPDWEGLCVITTRVPLTDLSPFEENDEEKAETVAKLDLENLDDQAGAALLKHLIKAEVSFRDLQQVVREVDGHALAITLLGNYLRDVHGSDLAGRFDLERLTVDVREGGHARRIMESYARWMERNGRFSELAVLALIGLFDRPAVAEAMDALLADKDLDPVTAELDRVGSNAWNRCLATLRGMGLLNNEIPEWPGAIDAHPLVREHFRDQLQKRDGNMWLRGNRTLFAYYQEQALPQPEDAIEMNKLYSAVTHGCAAGLYQKVFDDVLLTRVWRDRRTSFSTRRLGMTGSDLVALSNFFEHRRWTELKDCSLSPRARVLIRTNAGVRLRQLGRLIDARKCFGAVVREIDSQANAEPQELEDASYAAAQYCELLVIAGKLASSDGDSGTALANGQRAVEYSALGSDPYFAMHARSSLAEVHFMLGNLDKASELFDEAREIERQGDVRPPFLYSQSLFRYGYYLVEIDRPEQILEDARVDPEWGTNGVDSSLLSVAIRLLILGAAHRALLERGQRQPEFVAEANNIFDDCIAAFRTAGYSDYLVRGLLERAHFYRARHESADYLRWMGDLDKAGFEAQRGQMELLYVDVLLQRIAGYLIFGSLMSDEQRVSIRNKLQRSLAEVTELIRRLGYLRRRAMLAELNDMTKGL